MLILYLNWIIFQLYLNCSKICKNYQALFDFIISVKWANKCKTYNNSCKNCQALSFSPSPYLREIAGTKINFHTTPPHYTTGNFLRNNVNDVFTPMPSTAVATKIRPYICRVNNLKIIHLKMWLVVLKRTD